MQGIFMIFIISLHYHTKHINIKFQAGYNYYIDRIINKYLQLTLDNYKLQITTEQMEEGKRQVKKSYQQMEGQLMKTHAPINNIRTKNEQLQKNEKIYDQRRAQQRLAIIQQEAIISNKKNTALEIKWSELKEHQECESLFKEIQQQKQSFSHIVSAKDKLIQDFQNELKKKDDQYTKALKQEGEDIKSLVTKMREQYFALRNQSLKQLGDIQAKFEEERRQYIDNAKNQVDECFSKHVKMEHDFAENRKKAEEDFQKKIQQLRIDGMQNYTKTKIRMQNDIQNLEKCYEQMKALYQLNTQKLDYNLKVLKEKREQNHHAQQDLKKKLRFLIMKLRNLRDEYEKADQTFKDENKLLTTDYKRITRQFKQLQRKFKHFEKSDLERYNQIQSMNQIEVRQLKQKIIKCDIVIHNQQLGVQWAGTPQDEEKQKQNVLAAEQDQQDQQIQLLVSEQKLMEMIEILLEQADFIFDDKMRQQLQRASIEQKLKQKLDVLKKTLQIDSTDELNLFIEQMANSCRYVSEKEKHSALQQKIRKQQEARDEEDKQMKKKKKREVVDEKKNDKPVDVQPVQQQQARVDLKTDFKVDPTLVVDFLVDWMNNRDDRKRFLERTAKRSLKQLSERQKKQRIAKQGKRYWQKLTQVLPERTFRVWKVLEKSFTKYYELLLTRQKLIDQTGTMHSQNQQLKNLLNNYLQINHDLIIPPTRLMEKGD